MIDAGAPVPSASGVSSGAASPGLGARRVAAVLVIAVLIGVGAGFGLHALLGSSSHPQAAAAIAPGATAGHDGLHGQATWAAGALAAPAITTLRDQSGHRFAWSSLHGRTAAVVFFDSHCTQACPLEGRALARSERALSRAQRPELVIVSVNPLDTPASARAAARAWGLAGVGGWHWLMGSHRQLARVWKAYRIYVAPPRDGDIAHTEALYLLGRTGDERSGYLYPFLSRFVSSDLTRLASEPRG